MDRLLTERIEGNLDLLGLIGIKRVYGPLSKEAIKITFSYSQYLDLLLQEEVAWKQSHK